MIRPQKEELIKYSCLYKRDTDFAAYARLLQAKWREKHNYLANNKPNYGNFIDRNLAKSDRMNFLTENIKRLVSEKIPEVRCRGGFIAEPRIWNNLLTSQALCFNLFGEFNYPENKDLATLYFQKLFPQKVATVTKIDFEFSCRRRKPDKSAFDVFIEYANNKKQKCFIGIEVKYQECLKEETCKKALETFDKHKDIYVKLTKESKVFIDNEDNTIKKLKKPPLAQIWRDHLLSFNMSKDYEGIFVFLYPYENEECQNAVNKYQELLIDKNEERTKFYPRDLGLFINTLCQLHDVEWTRELKGRYLG